MPVLTVNQFGKGRAWYVATSPDEAFLSGFVTELCREHGIQPLIADAPESVEAVTREKDGKTYLFLLNHANEKVTIDLGQQAGDNLLTGESVSGND